MNLMKGLFDQGYHLFCDNFYSSPPLFRDLFSRGCFAPGTVRENRIGFPSHLGNKLTNKDTRSTMRWHRDGQLVFVKWKDTKDVCVISTFYEATATDMVKRRKKVDGKYEELEVSIPPPINNYNANMGGVDLSDQLIQYYAVLRKTRKWWKTFFHFIDIAIVNAYILYRQLPGNEKSTQKVFHKELAQDMVKRSGLSTNITTPGRPRRSNVRAEHCPVPIASADIIAVSKSRYGRKNCKLCFVRHKKEQRTPWKCGKCDLPLCLQLDRNCFQEWHTAACDQFREQC